jgi:hypothetical protein
LDIFPPDNTKTVSDEHGDSFHKDISERKRGTVGNGVQMRWLTTAGVLKGETDWQIQEAKEGEVNV